MKCGEPRPGSSYQECGRDLLHDGDHAYLGETWPRLGLAELDPAVAALIEKAAGPTAWDLNERAYPVIVEETTVRVVWVDAETEDAALDLVEDQPWEHKGEAINSNFETRRPDQWERRDAIDAENRMHVGPQITCPDCGRLSHTRAWAHDPYRKCHGPIVWEQYRPGGRAWRVHQQTPGAAS